MSSKTHFGYSNTLGGGGQAQQREEDGGKNLLRKIIKGEGVGWVRKPTTGISRLRLVLPSGCVALPRDKPSPAQARVITDPAYHYQWTVGDLSTETRHSCSEAAKSAG